MGVPNIKILTLGRAIERGAISGLSEISLELSNN